MTAAWPASLPQSPFLPVTDQRQTAVVRTSMDAGPPKMRRRFTAAVRQITLGMFLTGAERAVFDAFFATTLEEGALPFTWTDPVDDSSVDLRFVEPPAFTLVRPDSAASGRLWSASFKLEILP